MKWEVVAIMCNLYRMEDKDWVAKWAQDAESLINLMPAYQMNPDQLGPIVRNTADGRKQLAHARWGLPSPFFAIKQAAEARAAKLRQKDKPVRNSDCRPEGVTNSVMERQTGRISGSHLTKE